MADEDVLDEGGLEPATDEAAVDAAPVDDAPPAEPETYTREQLVEAMGPRFAERFATHEGLDAFKQFGSAYESATSLIGRGAHLEPQDEQVYRDLGIEPPAPAADPVEEPQGLWGVPWQVPTTWDEVQAYAGSDDPNARRLAWIAVASDPTAPEDVKQAYYAHWAQIDQAGAAAYTQQATMTAAEARLAALEERLEAKYAATHEDLVARNAQDLMSAAQAEVKGFKEHTSGVLELWNENEARMPGYGKWFLEATRPDQLKELRRLTLIAAAEAAPVRQAAAAQAADETDAAKRRAQTETSRTSGQPDTEQSAAKRKSLEDARRVGHRVF